jgi:hypothetical protein
MRYSRKLKEYQIERKVHLFLIIIVTIFIAPSITMALDCKPLDPRQQLSTSIETDIEGSAKTLLKVGSFQGKFENEIKEEVKNLYDKYPSADKIVIQSKFIYLFCTLLDESSDIESSKKLDMFNTFYDKMTQEQKEGPISVLSGEKPFFDNDVLRIEVVSLTRMGPFYTLKLKHINKAGKPIKLIADDLRKNTYMLDDLDNQNPYYSAELSDTGRRLDLPHNSPRIILFQFQKSGAVGKTFSFSSKYGYELDGSLKYIYVSIKDIKLQ